MLGSTANHAFLLIGILLVGSSECFFFLKRPSLVNSNEQPDFTILKDGQGFEESQPLDINAKLVLVQLLARIQKLQSLQA